MSESHSTQNTSNTASSPHASSCDDASSKKHKKKVQTLSNVVSHGDTAEVDLPPPTPTVKNVDFESQLLVRQVSSFEDLANNLSSPVGSTADVPIISVSSESPTNTTVPPSDADITSIPPFTSGETKGADESCITTNTDTVETSTASSVSAATTYASVAAAPPSSQTSSKPFRHAIALLPSMTREVEITLKNGVLVNPRVASSFLAALFDLCDSEGDEVYLENMKQDFLESQALIFDDILKTVREVSRAARLKNKTIETTRARDSVKERYREHILPSFLNHTFDK